MSSQAEVNQNPYQYILYYCNVDQKDATVYQTDLSDVCTIGYDGSDNLQVLTWLLGGYSQPSNATLMTFVLATVLAFYDNFYTIPAEIAMNEPYMISTANLANVRADASMIGFVVYDTTAQATKYWDGASWNTTASRYLSSSGGSVTGDIAITGNISQTLPSCISIWSSDTVSNSFSANTPEVIDITGFSQTVNPNSDFSYDSKTGECKYTGSVTRPFRVTIQHSYTALAVASTQTIYISKNGSTSISGARKVNSFLLLGAANVVSNTISDIISLATNDTVQFAGQLSTTNSVSYQAVSYTIEAL